MPNLGVYPPRWHSPYVSSPPSTISPPSTPGPGRPTVGTHSGGAGCGCGGDSGSGVGMVPLSPLGPNSDGTSASLATLTRTVPETTAMKLFNSLPDWSPFWFLAGFVTYRLLLVKK